MVLPTLILAFHYTAADATSVLVVVMLIFSAVVDVVLGGDGGVVAGAAGKKSVQDTLAVTQSTVDGAKTRARCAVATK